MEQTGVAAARTRLSFKAGEAWKWRIDGDRGKGNWSSTGPNPVQKTHCDNQITP